MSLSAILKDLPFETIRAAKQVIRVRWATVETPDGAPVVLIEGQTPETVEKHLRERHFEGTRLAYIYESEIDGEMRQETANLRRPEPPEEGIPKELHTRLFAHPEGTMTVSHFEASRFEAQDRHINEVGLSWGEGTDMALSVFGDIGWETRELEYPLG